MSLSGLLSPALSDTCSATRCRDRSFSQRCSTSPFHAYTPTTRIIIIGAPVAEKPRDAAPVMQQTSNVKYRGSGFLGLAV